MLTGWQVNAYRRDEEVNVQFFVPESSIACGEISIAYRHWLVLKQGLALVKCDVREHRF